MFDTYASLLTIVIVIAIVIGFTLNTIKLYVFRSLFKKNNQTKKVDRVARISENYLPCNSDLI